MNGERFCNENELLLLSLNFHLLYTKRFTNYLKVRKKSVCFRCTSDKILRTVFRNNTRKR